MFDWIKLLKSAARGIEAAAERFEESAQGATVSTDVTKTVSDAKGAALGFIKQGLAAPATDALTLGFTKIGLPSAIASDLAGAAVAQGEALLPSV